MPDAVVRAEPHDRIDDRGVVTAEGPHDTVFVPAAARRDSGVHLLAYEYSVDEVSAMVAGWADGSGLLDEQDYVALPEGALVIRTEPRLQVELAVADLYANFLIQPAPGESETPISPQQMIDWAERLAERVVAERA